jgi:tetratricopeptide (TPR) repeat protein
VLTGSVSRLGSGLRVNAELVDAQTSVNVWSGRFERTSQSSRSIQDEIVNGLCRELQIEIGRIESMHQSTDPQVRELVFKGFAAINAGRYRNVDALHPAETYFSKALALDPDNVQASIGLAAFHAHAAVLLSSAYPEIHLNKAEAILHRLIAQHPNLDRPYTLLGLVHIGRGENKSALRVFERAVEINPSNAPAHAQIGRALVRLGRPAEGLEHIHYAMRLSPRDPTLAYWYGFAGFAELELGHLDDAITSLRHAQALHPLQRNTQVLIAAEAMAGHMDTARELLKRLQERYPHLTRETLLKSFSQRRAQHSLTAQGMRKVLITE